MPEKIYRQMMSQKAKGQKMHFEQSKAVAKTYFDQYSFCLHEVHFTYFHFMQMYETYLLSESNIKFAQEVFGIILIIKSVSS